VCIKDDKGEMVYLRRVVVDLDDPLHPKLAATPVALPPAVVNPLWVNLYENVTRLGFDVMRVAPLHGEVQDFAVLRAAVAPAIAK
jgi:hypothetical protein